MKTLFTYLFFLSSLLGISQNSGIESTLPMAVNNIIEICPGDTIDFTAIDGSNYMFEWDLGTLGNQNNRIITQQFNNSGAFFVQLRTADQNSNPVGTTDYVTVVVSPEPVLDYTATDTPVLCLGDSMYITTTSQIDTVLTCDDAAFVAGTTFLPDGSGVSYQSVIIIDCFPDGTTLVNPANFLGVCMNMEHSYLGDLRIELIAPNGVAIDLKSSNFGGGVFLGEPIDDDFNINPGIGYDYCFTSQATTTMVGASATNTTIPAGDYASQSAFTGLTGVPLNGPWRVRITDNLVSDNGYIFSWFMKFGVGLESNINYTNPTIINESWSSSPDITSTGTNQISITPTQTGLNCYDYTTTDSNGCTYTEQYCIDVLDSQTDFEAVDLYRYDSDVNGTEDFNLDFNTARIIGDLNPITTSVLYYTTLADAQSQNNPIGSTSAFANTTNPQTIYARVDNINMLCSNIIVDFDLLLTTQPLTDTDNDGIPDLSEDLNENGNLNDDDTDGDGIPNYQDDDDDGDGVPTAIEIGTTGYRRVNIPFLDTDGDGIENYLDDDDDGDGVLTINEDYNNNDDPTDDDTDGSGIPDFLEVNITLSVTNIEKDAFSIYPNPLNGNSFSIKFLDQNGPKYIEVLNLNGRLILSKELDTSSNSINIELPELSTGMYLVRIDRNSSLTYKLIKS
ncbi:T9SS type A sorting domain-containing protein [Nonlabens sp. Asnod2-A12]|uniref:T9SS type A sorting domain-containing protein n=1 Tax=Nonlabens sp. Asnod2-A12 TaxID=3160578 RepID=UPI0038630239